MNKKLRDNYLRMLKENNLSLIKGESIKNRIAPIYCYDVNGYILRVTIKKLKKSGVSKPFYNSNKYVLYNIQRYLIIHNSDLKLMFNKSTYINTHSLLTFFCKKHNHYFKISWTRLSQKSILGCDICTMESIVNSRIKNIVNKRGSVGENRKDLIQYFKNKNEAFSYTCHSKHKVNVICPICGFEEVKPIYSLYLYGYNCPICGDATYMSENIVKNVLNQIKITYEREYSPEWAKSKRYDFYIPEKNIIIEAHGCIHYNRSVGWGKWTLEKIKENDKIKFDLAINNNIKKNNYIIINLKKTNFEYIKNQCIKSLKQHFHMERVDWIRVYSDSQKGVVKDISIDFKSGKSVSALSTCYNLHPETIKKYLRRGTKIGWCEYSNFENMERIKNERIIKLEAVE